MRLTSSRAYSRPAPMPEMPAGLVDLMNGLAKEVVKDNPTNVYEFCANHMEKLLVIRDGPSSKTVLTLEQKIERAQEKMRQKAKQRREEFDKQIKFHSHQSTDHELGLNVQGNSIKALVHHEIDLQNDSEVEISHDEQENVTGLKFDSQNCLNPPAVVVPNQQAGYEQIEEISEKLDEYQLTERVRTENNEPLKEEETTESEDADAPLQTITEEESLVITNSTVLPKITIGEGINLRDFRSTSDESCADMTSNITITPGSDLTKTLNVEHDNSELNAAPIQEPIEDAKNTTTKSDVKFENVTSNTDDDYDKSDDKANHIDKNNTDMEFAVVVSDTGNQNDRESTDDTLSENNAKLESALNRDNSPKTDSVKDIIEKKGLDDPSKNVMDIQEGQIEIMPLLPESYNKNARESDPELNLSSGDVVKLESCTIDNANNTNDIKNDDQSEKLQDNTESSNPKSDKSEVTNEDSMSIVESDMSKADDDSVQSNPNMDLETAAVTIQKVFRSFMFKSRNSTFEENTNEESNSIDEDNDKKEEYYPTANVSKERRPLGIQRMESVLQTVNEEKSLSLSTDDSSTLSSAATTIQAHVRGFLVRNRLNSSKTFSMNSLPNSHEVLEGEADQHKNKTVLNIHIVPEKGNFLSRDESLITSMELSLDGSPPSSVNLHPLSCDISERRKMLKREDAVQSVSPPSNNSGKLSEDSVKEVLVDENGVLGREATDEGAAEIEESKEVDTEISDVVSSASTATPTTVITISKSEDPVRSPRETEPSLLRNVRSFSKLSSDESDVISPFVATPCSPDEDTLLHSGEFHDVVLPTKVSRNDTPVVREFKNVLVYFLLWNSS